MKAPQYLSLLPPELILLAAENLEPRNLLSFLHADPTLSRLLTFRHTAVEDEDGNTILHLLAREGADGLLKLLLANKDAQANNVIQLDQKNIDGQTPLFLAAANSHEAVDFDGLTPLACAARGGGNEAVVHLLAKRSDVNKNSKDIDGLTPLAFAAIRGHEAVVELLLKETDVEADSRDEDCQTPLSLAAAKGHEAVVGLLVKRHDVNTNSKDDLSQTPLSWAARFGREAVGKLLLKQDDIDADSKDGYGQTPLSYASRAHKNMVLRAERYGVGANSMDNDAQTQILREIREREAVVKSLEARDDVNVELKDYKGPSRLTLEEERIEEEVRRLEELDEEEMRQLGELGQQ